MTEAGKVESTSSRNARGGKANRGGAPRETERGKRTKGTTPQRAGRDPGTNPQSRGQTKQHVNKVMMPPPKLFSPF